MIIKFTKIKSGAIIPEIPRHGDAGIDLIANNFSIDEEGNLVYGTGLACEFPDNFVGLLFPRSSVTKYDLILGNSVGVLDSSYRGEILVKFKLLNGTRKYNLGDKICQLVFLEKPKIEIVEVDYLSKTERDEGGFGSTGN